jgi:hypothetical protein
VGSACPELHKLQPGSGEILDTHGDTGAITPVLLLGLAIKNLSADAV